jgi:glycerate 2-kinase
MKIIVAPNALKGSLTADEAADAIITGIRRMPRECEIIKMPVADGGDGILEVLRAHIPGKMEHVEAADPLFRKRPVQFFVSPQQSLAVVEMAKVSGLAMLSEDQRNPEITTSYGTGEVIREALNTGIRNIHLGLGGSATVDGGMGIACALGVKFLDHDHRELPPVGSSLSMIRKMDLSGLDNRLKHVKMDAICDVNNPLLGPNGAAHIFGPQKGATPEQVKALETGLENLAKVILHETGVDIRDVPGAGAAGGVGGALLGIFKAELRPGIDVVLELLDMESHIQDADLVLTAEGQIDTQTVRGKAPAGVARLAKKHNVPCIALAGSIGPVNQSVYDSGITAVFSLCPGPLTLSQAMEDGACHLSNLAEQIMRIFSR